MTIPYYVTFLYGLNVNKYMYISVCATSSCALLRYKLYVISLSYHIISYFRLPIPLQNAPGAGPTTLLKCLQEEPSFVRVVHRVAHLHADEDGVEDDDDREEDVEPGVGHELVDATSKGDLYRCPRTGELRITCFCKGNGGTSSENL